LTTYWSESTNHRDDYSRPALRHGSLNSRFPSSLISTFLGSSQTLVDLTSRRRGSGDGQVNREGVVPEQYRNWGGLAAETCSISRSREMCKFAGACTCTEVCKEETISAAGFCRPPDQEVCRKTAACAPKVTSLGTTPGRPWEFQTQRSALKVFRGAKKYYCTGLYYTRYRRCVSRVIINFTSRWCSKMKFRLMTWRGLELHTTYYPGS